MSKVYVVQAQMKMTTEGLVPQFDFSSAEKYGELVFLLSPSASPFNPDPIIRELHEKLANYTTEDFILLTGNPCLIGWVVGILADKTDGKFKLLQWNGKEQGYIPVEVDNLFMMVEIDD